MKNIIFTQFLVYGFICLSATAIAQTQSENIASIKPTQTSSQSDSTATAQRTIERLSRLNRELQLLQASSRKSSSDSPDTDSNVDSMNLFDQSEIKQLPEFRTESRVDGITQRIDLLKDLIARQRAAAEAAKQKTQPPMLVPTQPEPAPLELESAPKQPQPQPTEPMLAPEPNIEGLQVLSTPVNSFELANSLYATGNYSEALKSYELLLADETVPVDRDWLQLFAANCYRQQKEISTAENLYRDVAASKAQAYPSDQAKWYLDHLTRRKQIAAEMQIIDAELQSLNPKQEQK